MASLNSDGTRIVPLNYSFRNVGQAITINKLTEVGDISTQVDQTSEPVIAAHETSDVSLHGQGRFVKQITDASLNGVERQIHLDGETLPTPAVADELVARSVVALGNVAKISESRGDSLIERAFDV